MTLNKCSCSFFSANKVSAKEAGRRQQGGQPPPPPLPQLQQQQQGDLHVQAQSDATASVVTWEEQLVLSVQRETAEPMVVGVEGGAVVWQNQRAPLPPPLQQPLPDQPELLPLQKLKQQPQPQPQPQPQLQGRGQGVQPPVQQPQQPPAGRACKHQEQQQGAGRGEEDSQPSACPPPGAGPLACHSVGSGQGVWGCHAGAGDEEDDDLEIVPVEHAQRPAAGVRACVHVCVRVCACVCVGCVPCPACQSVCVCVCVHVCARGVAEV